MLVLEIALGVVLGMLILRALPGLVATAVFLLVLVAAIAIAAAIVILLYRNAAQVATVTAVLLIYSVGSILVTKTEAKIGIKIDEAVVVVVCIGLVLFFAIGAATIATANIGPQYDSSIIVAMVMVAGLLSALSLLGAYAMVMRIRNRHLDARLSQIGGQAEQSEIS